MATYTDKYITEMKAKGYRLIGDRFVFEYDGSKEPDSLIMHIHAK